MELQEFFIFENKRNGFLKTISAWLKLNISFKKMFTSIKFIYLYLNMSAITLD